MVFKKSDISYLKSLTSNNDRKSENITRVIELYEQRKIPRKDTAELLILKLQSSGKTKNKQALEKLESYDKKESITGSLKKSEEDIINVRIVGKKKVEAIEKIKQKFKQYKEVKIKYKNIDRALSHVEFSIEHLKTEEKDLTNFLSKIKDKVKSELNKILIIKSNIQVCLGVNAEFVKEKVKDPFNEESETVKEVDNTILKTPIFDVYSKDTSSDLTDKLIADMDSLFSKIEDRPSAWRLNKLNYVYIEVYNKKPIRGSNYIPTPDKYKNSRCGSINIQNDDQECFRWCMKYHQSEKKRKKS